MRFEDVFEMNRSGLTLEDIARHYGVQWSTVRRMFQVRGVSWLSRQDFERAARLNVGLQARSMRERGLSPWRVAKTLTTSRKRVVRALGELERGERLS